MSTNDYNSLWEERQKNVYYSLIERQTCKETTHHKNNLHQHHSTFQYERQFPYTNYATNPEIMLPWLTGHMCWEMVESSAFFALAHSRGENVIAGPSGHTHMMLTFMTIFHNFDLEKWTLICLVWLMADLHSVFEVLSAAMRHGLCVEMASKWECPVSMLRVVYC